MWYNNNIIKHGGNIMKIYKEYSLQVKFEIDCITKEFFIKKRETLVKKKDYRFIVATHEEANQKAKQLAKDGLFFLREEIQLALNNKKRYELYNWGDFSKNIVEVFSIKHLHSKLNETINFSECSVAEAFQKLTIEQFQEMWGNRIVVS